MTLPQSSLRARCSAQVYRLQDDITRALGALDGVSFQEDLWTRPGGGGGRTRVILEGKLFEKGGVNVSEVFGDLPVEFSRQLGAESSHGAGGSRPGTGAADDRSFYATGISLVLHPRNPRVPTVHANFRYLEKGGAWWFGGGADLTPYRLYPEDARHFHATWRKVADRHDPGYYPRFKKQCDEYFYLAHRQEARGIGGIFFDYLTGDADRLFAFWKDAGEAFLESYVPIAERRRNEVPAAHERDWQLLRRGRYVEFNLVYDRGTVFGLKTGGRIESILMSLPPLVRWGYHSGSAAEPDVRTGSPEEELLDVLRNPRDWLASGG